MNKRYKTCFVLMKSKDTSTLLMILKKLQMTCTKLFWNLETRFSKIKSKNSTCDSEMEFIAS
jgi:hypothetical protein